MKNKFKLLTSGKYEYNFTTLTLLLIFIVLVSVSFSTPVHRWGDASVYYMQVQSIANDFDIQYTQIDLQNALINRFDDLPSGMSLIKNSEGEYFYGAEFTYALFATPFYIAFGNNGIILFNALMFFLMIYMGYIYLGHNNDNNFALLFSASYFFLSAAFVYIFWIHTEVYNMFLIMLGLFLWSEYVRNTDTKETMLYIASLVFGLAVFAKTINSMFILPPLIWELYNKRFRRFVVCLFSFLLVSLFLYGLFYSTTGQLSPYAGNRFVYLHKFPYMSGYGPENEVGLAVSINPQISKYEFPAITLIAYNMFYYVFGRFSGIIWYYPGVLVVLYLFFKNIGGKDGEKITSLLILFAILGTIMVIITLTPYNYLGGTHVVGNRWFYVFPAFIFLIDKIEIDKKMIAFFVVALFFIVPININPIDASISPAKHTKRFPYTILPVEYSQIDALPYWDTRFDRCRYDDSTTFYLTDNNVHRFEENGFWIKGGSSSTILLKTEKTENLTLKIHNGIGDNSVKISVGGDTKNIRFKEDYKTLEVLFNPQPGFEYNMDGTVFYKIDVDSRYGFIPALETNSRDARYLGVFIYYTSGIDKRDPNYLLCNYGRN